LRHISMAALVFAAVGLLLSGALAPLAVFGAARAEEFPARTITLVVPYPPGGGVDAMARVIAEKFSALVGQQVVVDNRAGGSALVGTRSFLKSQPDGYTLFLGHTGSLAINPSLFSNAGFDPRRDFAPIGLIASMPVAIVANPSFPAKTIRELLTLARTERRSLTIGTAPVGTGSYLSAELFKAVTEVDAVIVPYKGTGQVINDVVGNHVPLAFGVLPPALGNLQAGTLRAIAVLSPARFSLLPDVPTASESGLPGFETVLHYGVLAPAGTPRQVIDRLNIALRSLTDNPEVRSRIHAEGGEPLTSTPEEYARDIDSEETKWGMLVRKLNLKVE
jgi:tripartite-type tricarboxylate transporter receptor subunit TctC